MEIYWSVVPRKVVTLNDFPSLAQEQALLAFQQRHEKSAASFRRPVTGEDLDGISRLHAKAFATAV